jgi:hypothetical protein
LFPAPLLGCRRLLDIFESANVTAAMCGLRRSSSFAESVTFSVKFRPLSVNHFVSSESSAVFVHHFASQVDAYYLSMKYAIVV